MSDAEAQTGTDERKRRSLRRLAIRAAKWLIALVVLVMLGRQIRNTLADLQRSEISLDPSPLWLCLSGLLYLAGLALSGVYFYRVMRCSRSPVPAYAALRAYLIGHLGKYVPGKALVLVIRAGLVVPWGGRPATAVFATLYETFVMMATGALLASAVFLLEPSARISLPFGAGRTVDLPLWLLSIAVAIPLLIAVESRVFPQLSKILRSPFPGVGPEAVPELSRRLLAEGLLWTGAGWILLGLSQVLVLRGLFGDWPSPGGWPAIVASTALATVAGFVVAVMPGGLGVREGVLMLGLAPVVGTDRAVVGALGLRLVWVAAELVAAAVLSLLRPAGAAPSATGSGAV